MQITVENGGGCKRLIRAEVPAEVVSQKLADGYRDINRQFTFPGFRKGKAPRAVLEKRFGPDVMNDVRQSLADEALKQAIEQSALKILGQPELVGDVNVQPGAPVTLTLEAEVFPEFQLPEYKGVQVQRPVPKVEEHEIYARQRTEQMAAGKMNPVEGAARKGHLLRANVHVKHGDEVIFRQNGGLLEVGYPWIAGLKAEGGEKQLTGLKAGESKELKAALPADFGRDDIAGKDCAIHIEVVAVLEYEGPDLEAFAKAQGKESLAAWSDEVKAELLKDKEGNIDRVVEDRVVRKIVDQTSIDLPEKFSRRRAGELVQQQAYRMYQQGAADEDVRALLNDSRDKGIDDVKASLKRAFIVDAIAKKERVIITEDEVMREVSKLAAAIGREAEELKAELRQRGTLDGMREEMKSNKVLSLLRQKAKYE